MHNLDLVRKEVLIFLTIRKKNIFQACNIRFSVQGYIADLFFFSLKIYEHLGKKIG